MDLPYFIDSLSRDSVHHGPDNGLMKEWQIQLVEECH